MIQSFQYFRIHKQNAPQSALSTFDWQCPRRWANHWREAIPTYFKIPQRVSISYMEIYGVSTNMEILAKHVPSLKGNFAKYLLGIENLIFGNFRCICILLHLLDSAWEQNQTRKQEIYRWASSITVWKQGPSKINVLTVWHTINFSGVCWWRSDFWIVLWSCCLNKGPLSLPSHFHSEKISWNTSRNIHQNEHNCHDIFLQFSEFAMSEGPGGENSGNIIVIHPGSLFLRSLSRH